VNRRENSADAAGFGALLRACRLAANLSQDELAERSGLTTHTISELERARTRSPHRDSVHRLAEALGLRDQARAEFIAAAGRRLAAAASITKTGAGQPRADAPAGGRIVPRQLPAATRHFTGRERELDELLTLAQTSRAGASASAGAGAVMIWAVDGMGGIGKTALAVHAAHRLRDQFPDGQLMLDLHGYTTDLEPLTASDALDRLLLSLGVRPQQIPPELDARAALYRDRLAATRTLIVLDNVTGTAQIRPLLPGAAGCLVLATSRRRLTGLTEAHTLALDILPQTDAIALLDKVAGPGRLDPGDPLVPELVTLCGHLPLTIGIIGARLRHHPGLSLTRILSQLRDDSQRLARLDDSEGDTTLTAVFDLSLRDLPPATRTAFRLLGLIPGGDFDGYAAANLAGTALAAAEDMLDSLVEHNLLIPSAPARYRLHDLVRAYTRTLPTPRTSRQQNPPAPAQADSTGIDADAAAMDRLLDYYLHTTQQADRRLTHRTHSYTPAVTHIPHCAPILDTQQQATDWIRTELANLTAAVSFSADLARPWHAVALPAALHGYLYLHGPWTLAGELHTAVIEAARRLGDRHGEATARNNLGEMWRMTGGGPAATRQLRTALGLYRELGDRLGEATVRNNLGEMWRMTGDHPAATRQLEIALGLFRELGDRLGEAYTLNNLGDVRRLTGDYPAAIQDLKTALGLFRELGDRLGEAKTRNYLGYVWRMTGDYPAATRQLEIALGLHRDIGSLLGQANTLNYLGEMRRLTGDYPAATRQLETALGLYRDIGSLLGEANTLGYLGYLRLMTGDYPAATQQLETALGLFRDIGNRVGEANTLGYLGEMRRLTGDYPAATRQLETALSLWRDLGQRQGEAETLNRLGTLHLATGEPQRALACYRQALDLANAFRLPAEQASALEGLGHCHRRTNDQDQAAACLRQSLEIFERLGVDADTNRVRGALRQRTPGEPSRS